MLSHLHALRDLLLLVACVAAATLNADDRILIEAKLNDQPLKLALDTGASELIVFRSIVEKGGLNTDSPTTDTELEPGQVLLSRTEPVKFEIFGQIIPNVRLAVFDHPTSFPPDIDGVLGWSNIRNNIWFLSGSTLTLTALTEVSPETAGWVKLQEVKDRDTLGFELPPKHSGTPVYLGIDTGLDSGVRLSTEAWAQWRATHRKQAVTLEAFFMPGAGGNTIAEVAWADEIDLGGLTLHGVQVTKMSPYEAIIHPPGATAVLGLAALKRIDTVLDGKSGVAYAHPLNTPPSPIEHNRLGAVFVMVDPQASNDLIAHVAKNSPAAKAGLRDGDVLLKIDQLDVTPWRTTPGIMPLRRFWTQPAGTKLRLTVRRDGGTLTKDVTLRNILGPGSK